MRLGDELDRRHIESVDDSPPESHQQLEIRELVTVRQFRDLPEALLAKGSLESAGIECFLADENLVRLDWFISNFIGGIKLNVRTADAANAQKLLDEPILEGLYVQGVGLYEQPRCPKCQSLDVNFQELDRPIAYMPGAFLRVPCPSSGRHGDATPAMPNGKTMRRIAEEPILDPDPIDSDQSRYLIDLYPLSLAHAKP